MLLPYIEQDAIYRLCISNGGSNTGATNTLVIKIFLCPSDANSIINGLCANTSNGSANGWAATSYAANHLVFGTYQGTVDSSGNNAGLNQPAWDGTGYSPGRYTIANIPDGTSNTACFLERYAAQSNWWQMAWAWPCNSSNCYDSASYPIVWNGQGAQSPIMVNGMPYANAPAYSLSSNHTAVCIVAMMDGSVRTISSAVSPATLNLVMCPNDGAPLPTDW
jgi:hypothetical protein